MWEPKDAFIFFIISPIKILSDSLKIFNTKKLVFFSIFTLTTLPLSFLTFTLTVSTHARVSQIQHLEAVAHVASTRVEARHVWHESRICAVSLFRIRALFAALCFPLSLAAAVASVHASISAAVSSSTFLSAVKDVNNWKRPAVTVIFVYCILLTLTPVPRVISVAFGSSHLTLFLIRVIGLGFEIYLSAILSLGLVTSVAEDRVGWDAIRVGYNVIQGRKFCGWVLSGLFVLVSGFIDKRMEVLLEENRNKVEIEIRVWDERVLVLIFCYAFVVLASYVVTTVFYCDGRRRHDIKEQQQLNYDVPEECVDL